MWPRTGRLVVRPNATDRRNRSRLLRLNRHRPIPQLKTTLSNSATPRRSPRPTPSPRKTRKPNTSKTRSCNVVAKSAASPALGNGVVAQLVERLVRNEKVRGSTPLGSTTSQVCSPVYLSPVYLSPVYLSPVYLSPVCIDALRATTQPTCGPSTDLLLNRTRRLVYTAPLSWSPSDRSPSDSAMTRQPGDPRSL